MAAKKSVVCYLKKDGPFINSYKLKLKLWEADLKPMACESPDCKWVGGWVSVDGRIILELDHINRDRTDNRLENLVILCPNCHALKEGARIPSGNCARKDVSATILEGLLSKA